MAVYLLHCERKLAGHAHHYTGYTSDLAVRIAAHEAGNSAKIVHAYAIRDIRWVVARVWPDGTPADEKRIKRQHNAPRFCPICRGKVHPGYSVDIKQLLLEKGPPALTTHQGKRRPMNHC